MSKRDPIYKVIFLNQGQVYEMYAKQIFQSDLWGFLEVEEFVFGERSQLVVDPSEEKLKAQFEGVVRSFVPMHAIIRIDEVERTQHGATKREKSSGRRGVQARLSLVACQEVPPNASETESHAVLGDPLHPSRRPRVLRPSLWAR